MEKAVRNSPGDDRLLNNLGLLYNRTARYDLAIEQFERVLQRTPGNLLTHFNLGFALLQQGHHDAARSHFLRAVRGGRDFNTANYYLAEIEFAADNLTPAAQYAETFLAVSGGDDTHRQRAAEILRACK
jgi:Tfp pilus assembly protein PilF